jgi:hypothetical protein
MAGKGCRSCITMSCIVRQGGHSKNAAQDNFLDAATGADQPRRLALFDAAAKGGGALHCPAICTYNLSILRIANSVSETRRGRPSADNLLLYSAPTTLLKLLDRESGAKFTHTDFAQPVLVRKLGAFERARRAESGFPKQRRRPITIRMLELMRQAGMTESIDDIVAGLWENGRDSITHALNHFSERDRNRSDRPHHDKWIVLSVHHAAECICNMRLLELDPSCPLFLRKGSVRFPSLSETIKQLQLPVNSGRLTSAEIQLLLLLSELPDVRNQFMHRTAPKDVDVSIAAMCMIGILKYIERLKGESAADIIWQSPPIEGDVVAAIRAKRLHEYSNFVAVFLKEKYPNRWLPQCPSCGVQAVVSSTCEACFAELNSIRCSDCDEEIYFLPWQRKYGDPVVECQDCGLKQNL